MTNVDKIKKIIGQCPGGIGHAIVGGGVGVYTLDTQQLEYFAKLYAKQEIQDMLKYIPTDSTGSCVTTGDIINYTNENL